MKKRFVALFLTIASMLAMFTFPVAAANTAFDWDEVASSTPVSLYANKKITTYSNRSLSSKTGSIYAGDLIKITNVYDDEVARVQYPVSGGTKKAFVSLDALGLGDFKEWKAFTAGVRMTAYRMSDMKKTFGTIYLDDKCWVISESNTSAFVLYPVGKGFKVGYVGIDLITTKVSKKNPSSSGKSSDDILYDVPHFQQSNKNWKNIVLNSRASVKRTIGSHGCTTTAAAMLTSFELQKTITPAQIVASSSYTSDNLLEWDSLPIDVYLKTHNKTMNASIRKDLLELLEDGPVIVGAAQNSNGARQHWCIVIGFSGDSDNPKNSDFIVLDPAKSSPTSLNDFLQNRTYIKRFVYTN